MRLAPAVAVLGAWLLACGATSSDAQKGPRPDVIYGDDDRLDLYQVKDPRLLKLADSAVALFQSGHVSSDGSTGRAKLSLKPYGEGMRLCKDEPFYDQSNGAYCSGFLVGPDLVMTAGHCVRSDNGCKDARFVFGFSLGVAGKTPDSVPAGEVYSCAKLLGRQQEAAGPDWALVRLDRAVAGHAPLALNKAGGLKDGALLFVIGHPAGLPTKVAGGARVRDASPAGYFVANLDTYGGNSGSAVFNAATGLVEGILVRGENDYVDRGGCRVSNRCPDGGCRGEDVTKIAAAMGQLPDGGISRKAPRAESPGPALLSLLESAPRKAPLR